MLQALHTSNTQVKLLRDNLRALYDRYRACLDALAEAQETGGTVLPLIYYSLLVSNYGSELHYCLYVSSDIYAIVEVKTKRQNLFLIFENDHLKLRILVYSGLQNQRIWPVVATAIIYSSG